MSTDEPTQPDSGASPVVSEGSAVPEKPGVEVPPEVAIAMGRFKQGEFFALKGVWFEVIGFVAGRMVLYPMGYTAKEMKRYR